MQNTADIVSSGVAENRNNQGTKSGWNGTCYMLTEHWMEEHGIQPLQLSRADAKTRLFAWLEPSWEESALVYLQKKLVLFPA